VKTYHAVIEPTEATREFAHEDTVALHRMELIFTIHERSPTQNPERIVKSTLKNMVLLGVMEITSITEVEPGNAAV
jgi:hypothetical protein